MFRFKKIVHSKSVDFLNLNDFCHFSFLNTKRIGQFIVAIYASFQQISQSIFRNKRVILNLLHFSLGSLLTDIRYY